MNSDVRNNLILLFGILIHNLTYPLAGEQGLGSIAFYAFYSLLYVFGVWTLSRNQGFRLGVILVSAVVFVMGVLNAYFDYNASKIGLIIFSIVYYLILIIVLVQYIFRTKTARIDIVLAATSLYLVIGSGYAAIYALIEVLAPGSFVSTLGMKLSRQHFVYFSYVTLTTLGYGDIIPKAFFAQAFAAFEAVTGVLYTVILLARLVGNTVARK